MAKKKEVFTKEKAIEEVNEVGLYNNDAEEVRNIINKIKIDVTDIDILEQLQDTKRNYIWATTIVLCTFLTATVLCMSWVKVTHIKTHGTIETTRIQVGK